MKKFLLFLIPIVIILNSSCGIVKNSKKSSENSASSEVESSEADSYDIGELEEFKIDNVRYSMPKGSFDQEYPEEDYIGRFYHTEWGTIYVSYQDDSYIDWHAQSSINDIVDYINEDSNCVAISTPRRIFIDNTAALSYSYSDTSSDDVDWRYALYFNSMNGYVGFIITSYRSEDDAAFFYDELVKNIHIDDTADPVNLATTTTTTTTKATTKATTTTVAPPAFDVGEEIWIKGKVVDITGSNLTLQDYDGFNWAVNCSVVEDMSKLKNLVSGKYVKLTGDVTGNLKVDFVNIATGGKVYTKNNFIKLVEYHENVYKVGQDIPAGEYVLFATSMVSGYMAITSDANGNDIIDNDNFDYNQIITVRNGQFLELIRCKAVPISQVSELDTSGEGVFKIGTFLPAGEYKLQATANSVDGYYCIYSDPYHENIISNDNFSGSNYVTVQNGQYLELVRCKIVK